MVKFLHPWNLVTFGAPWNIAMPCPPYYYAIQQYCIYCRPKLRFLVRRTNVVYSQVNTSGRSDQLFRAVCIISPRILSNFPKFAISQSSVYATTLHLHRSRSSCTPFTAIFQMSSFDNTAITRVLCVNIFCISIRSVPGDLYMLKLFVGQSNMDSVTNLLPNDVSHSSCIWLWNSSREWINLITRVLAVMD